MIRLLFSSPYMNILINVTYLCLNFLIIDYILSETEYYYLKLMISHGEPSVSVDLLFSDLQMRFNSMQKQCTPPDLFVLCQCKMDLLSPRVSGGSGQYLFIPNISCSLDCSTLASTWINLRSILIQISSEASTKLLHRQYCEHGIGIYISYHPVIVLHTTP
jgi:hypothetical protein